MADWKEAVFRINSSQSGNDGFGTAFVFHRDAGRSYLLTCWHVIKTVGSDSAEVGGLPVELLVHGEGNLDLAVIAVDGLPPRTPVLPLGSPGHTEMAFETRGYTWFDEVKRSKAELPFVTRTLRGTFGEDIGLEGWRGRKVPAWDLNIAQPDDFAHLQAGYSGAPVRDPMAGRVVGIVSHRRGSAKGHALCIGNLDLLRPRLDEVIPGFSSAGPLPDGDYVGDHGYEWLASTLDHEAQLEPVETLLGPAVGKAAKDRLFFVFEGCLADCPIALAQHIALEQGGPPRRPAEELATELSLTQLGRSGFWHALVKHVHRETPVAGTSKRQEQVLAWINRKPFHMLYAAVPVE